MNELLFECYHVPQVVFGIDSLYSLYYNQPMQGELSKTLAKLSFHLLGHNA
jgi:actin-related protein 5